VPVEERSTRSAERCDQHPARQAVAHCDACGRPLCLGCAVPVRGRVFGAECLPESAERGTPARAARPRPPLTGARVLQGAGFALALLATALPWSRFGMGSGAFGAWGRTPRWALVVTVAALAGCLLWAIRQLVGRPDGPASDAWLAGLGGLVILATLLSVWHPPAFTRTWLGPWTALASGVVACWASVASLRGARRHAGAAI
jgi:hypothetical protein